MTKFEEEVKRPANGPLTELNNNMQEVFSQYRKMRQYADYLEYELKQKDEHILKIENENSFMRDERTTFDSNGMAVEPKLQQQALPVVPDFIGKLINTFGTPEDGKYINYAARYPENQKELEWIDNHQKTWLTALLIGFRVEKQKLFYLKNKLTKAFLYDNGLDFGECDENCKNWDLFKTKFTQQEIDSMQTGSYELVPVEDVK